MKQFRLLFLVLAFTLIHQASLESAERPKLVILISIDQMQAEYVEWYRAEFTSGLKLIVAEGTMFTNADLNFAPSETGPGHAALCTGAYPVHNGIVANDGTPYRYDTHVPIVFWGSGIAGKHVSRLVHTVDIAPTIAKALGFAPPSNIDGKALKETAR